MGRVGKWALSAFDALEAQLEGPLTLDALMLLLSKLPPHERAEGLLRAIDMAARLSDDRFEVLVEEFAELQEAGDVWTQVLSTVRALTDRGDLRLAERLAGAEKRRAHRAPRAVYLHALCLQQSGQPADAIEALRSITSSNERLMARVNTGLCRALSSLGRWPEAALLAQGLLPAEGAAAAERMMLATAALRSRGRYARAGALDILLDLCRHDESLAELAVKEAAEHADARQHMLSEIELDRLRAIFSEHRDAESRAVGLECLEALAGLKDLGAGAAVRAAHGSADDLMHLSRCKAILEGQLPGPAPTDPRARLAWLALGVVGPLLKPPIRPEEGARWSANIAESWGESDEERRRRSRHALAELVGALDRAEPAPTEEHPQSPVADAPLWTALEWALASGVESDGAKVGRNTRRLAQLLLERRGTPPRGFLGLSRRLERLGETNLATLAKRRSLAHREPGAKTDLGGALRRRGWQAAAGGDREGAIKWLREAKSLLMP